MILPQLISTAILALAAAASPARVQVPRDPLAGLSIHHVQVSVADADRLAAWYVDKLGFRITKRAVAGGLKIVWIDIGGFRLGLAQVAGSRRDPSQSVPPPGDAIQQGYRQIDFAVRDVDAAYRALLTKGVRFAVPPTSYAITNIRLATMLDPEGNAISLYQDLSASNALVPRGEPPFSGERP